MSNAPIPALTGIHHLTAVSADAPGNHAFYTKVLGMRLVKRTVNQDDTSAYHLFYGDGVASPGSDITFFEWPVPPSAAAPIPSSARRCASPARRRSAGGRPASRSRA